MNKIAFVFLVIAILTIELEAVNGKITTTRCSSICGKGRTIIFPTYVSNMKDVSSTDPSFFKKCKKVPNIVGLQTLCASGPKYECSKPTTSPTTTVSVTTPAACNMTSTTTPTSTTTSTSTTTPTSTTTLTSTPTAPPVCSYGNEASSVPTRGNCSSPFQYFDPYGCFMIVSASLDFCGARKICQDNGGDIWTSAYLDSVDNFNNVASYFETLGISYSWIGIYGNEANLYWLNGTVANDIYNSMKLSENLRSNNTGFVVLSGSEWSTISNSTFYGWELAKKHVGYTYICERLP